MAYLDVIIEMREIMAKHLADLDKNIAEERARLEREVADPKCVCVNAEEAIGAC